jgi:S1-C subfamily serine protease
VRAQLLHLSGPWRGRTKTYADARLLIGSDPAAQVRFPARAGVAPRHAEIVFERAGCAFWVRPIDGKVFVNRREIEEAILEPDDLLEIGIGGPRLRFGIYVPEGTVCKPVRQMLHDARAVGKESGAVAFGSSLTRDLLTHASLRVKIGVPLAVLAILMPVAFLAGWLGGRPARSLAIRAQQRSSAVRDALADLRAELDALREAQPAPTREEVDALRAELAAHTRALERLAAEDAAVRRIHAELARSVCLIHGIYGFAAAHDGGEEWLESADGERLQVEYLGSGFLATAQGHVITNRHVAAPWTEVPEQQRVIELGFEPRFVRLVAIFPEREAVAIDPSGTRLRDDEIDVAVVRVAIDGVAPLPLPLPLPLSTEDPGGLAGKRVLLAGYPTGVGALLAKADAAIARRLTAGGADLTGIVAGLIAERAIAPSITQGALGAVLPTKLVYDAETTSGGSGGPVFGPDGTVIGVNFAVLQGFGGSNFGVPIRFARELLP